MTKQTKTLVSRESLRARYLSRAIDHVGQSGFLPGIIDYIRVDVPFVGIFLLLLDEQNRPMHLYDTIRSPYRVNFDLYLDGLFQLDPFYARFCRKRESGAMLIRDVAPDRFHLTEYYRRFYRNIDLRDEMAIFTDLEDGRFLFYSIGRRSNEPRFKQRELAAIQRDTPVLAALGRQHFVRTIYNRDELTGGGSEVRLEFALERFGENLLTPREHQVAVYILKGHSSKSLAREIDISPETVKIHRRNIYRKLSVSSQSELFLRFLNTIG